MDVLELKVCGIKLLLIGVRFRSTVKKTNNAEKLFGQCFHFPLAKQLLKHHRIVFRSGLLFLHATVNRQPWWGMKDGEYPLSDFTFLVCSASVCVQNLKKVLEKI